MGELHCWRDAAHSPVLDPLHAAWLLEAKTLCKLGWPTEGLNQPAVRVQCWVDIGVHGRN